MKVSDLLRGKRAGVSTTAPDRSLKNAADRLRLENIGALVVTERGSAQDRLLGVISERDIVRAFSRHGERISSLQVKDIMVSAVTCASNDDLRSIMTLMTRERVRHIPVLDGNRLIGIISIGDVVNGRVHDLELEASVLRDAYMSVH